MWLITLLLVLMTTYLNTFIFYEVYSLLIFSSTVHIANTKQQNFWHIDINGHLHLIFQRYKICCNLRCKRFIRIVIVLNSILFHVIMWFLRNWQLLVHAANFDVYCMYTVAEALWNILVLSNITLKVFSLNVTMLIIMCINIYNVNISKFM